MQIQPAPGMAYEHEDGEAWLVKSIGDVIALTDFAGASDLYINRDAFEVEFTPMGDVEHHEIDDAHVLQVAPAFASSHQIEPLGIFEIDPTAEHGDTQVVTLFALDDGAMYPVPMTGGSFEYDASNFIERKKANVRSVLSLAEVDDVIIFELLERIELTHVPSFD